MFGILLDGMGSYDDSAGCLETSGVCGSFLALRAAGWPIRSCGSKSLGGIV